MADKKISALTAATTPLAGTEVLPIVQSATTVKASIANIQAAPVSAGVAYGVQHLDSSKTPTTTTSFTYNTANISSNVPTLANYGGTAAKTGSYRCLSSDGSVDFAMYSTATAPTFMVFTNQPLVFGTNSANTFRLETTGDASVLTGNLVIGTSGKGIDFSATSGSGTSELLADYEEGTWTPTFAFAGGSTGITGTFEGSYTKVGRLVTLIAQVTLTNKGSSTGAISITNLPFNGGNYLPSTSIEGSGSVGLYTATSSVYGMTVVLNNGDTLLIYGAISSGAAALTQLDNTNITNTTALRFSIQYFA
jgi:hypothetical protein